MWRFLSVTCLNFLLCKLQDFMHLGKTCIYEGIAIDYPQCGYGLYILYVSSEPSPLKSPAVSSLPLPPINPHITNSFSPFPFSSCSLYYHQRAVVCLEMRDPIKKESVRLKMQNNFVVRWEEEDHYFVKPHHWKCYSVTLARKFVYKRLCVYDIVVYICS